MKKIFFVVTFVILSILCLSLNALADDYTNAYFDLSSMSSPGINGYVGLLGIGIDYQGNNWMVGGNLATSVYFSNDYPKPNSGWSEQVYFLYAGYNFLQGPASLGPVVTYYDWTGGFTVGNTYFWNNSWTLGVGIRGEIDLGSANISALYSYGLNHRIWQDYYEGAHLNYLEIKGTFRLNETLGLHLKFSTVPETTGTLSGTSYKIMSTNTYGIGLDYKF